MIFNRDITTGSLSFSTCIKGEENGINGLKYASAVIVSPDNKNVYVTGYSDNSLAIFNRDTVTGTLTYSASLVDGIAGVDGLYQPTSITVSPDTRNVYVSSSGKKAITVFNRDVNTGALDYNTCIKNGQEDVDGLFSPAWISMSHDNYRVYVVGENRIGLFNRDPITGTLSYRYCIKNREKVVDGLTDVSDMAMSHDNRNVYTISSRENILSVFNRDAITGKLTYNTCFKDGQDKIDWLAQPSTIAVSSDNKNVYVVSGYDSAVSIFNRDTVTGALTYNTCIRMNQDGMNGLSTAYSCIISPDDRNLYISGQGGMLIILNRDVNSGILTYNTTLIEGQNGSAGLELV